MKNKPELELLLLVFAVVLALSAFVLGPDDQGPDDAIIEQANQ